MTARFFLAPKHGYVRGLRPRARVPVLARKPGGLRNGAPFREWVLPSAMEKIRRKLQTADDGDRQIVKILTCVLTDGISAVEAACQEALDQGVSSADMILNILARSRDLAPGEILSIPQALKLAHEPIADCARYDSLRRTSNHATHRGSGPDGSADSIIRCRAKGASTASVQTFRQASELGAHVRKGETSSTVIYASRFTKTETDARGDEVERDIPFLRTYGVFNVEQIEGLPAHYYHRPDPVNDPVERIESADRFFANAGAGLRYGGSRAFYAPSSDHIQMPPFETFRDAASYAAILSHEHIHWTAKADRVGRDLSRYGKDRTERAREELCAQIGSALLCADLGIVPELEPRPDHAAYLQSWLMVLANDKRAIFQAAAHAQRAVNYLHGLQPSSETAEAA